MIQEIKKNYSIGKGINAFLGYPNIKNYFQNVDFCL